VHLDLLAASPRILHHGGVAHVRRQKEGKGGADIVMKKITTEIKVKRGLTVNNPRIADN
jgi:hypothetical protein